LANLFNSVFNSARNGACHQRPGDTTMPLRSIESRRLYRQIADQLRNLIAAGEFPSGERLPAERDLACSASEPPFSARGI